MKVSCRSVHILALAAAAVTSSLPGVVSALPFRTRGKSSSSSQETEQEENDPALAARAFADAPVDALILDGVAEFIQVKPSSNNPKRNAVVESYFEQQQQESQQPDLDVALDSQSPESAALVNEIQSHVSELNDFLLQTRRTLHRHPELMYNEQLTSGVIQTVLSDLGISFSTGWAKNKNPHIHTAGPGGYGVVADIGTGQEPCVLLRADMDALPIFERTEGIDEFKSAIDDKMHACGHDGHTTMLLGAAAVLKSMEDSLNGTVRLLFQPAEEGGAGAKRMREEGVLELHPKPQYAFGMHLWPTLPSGVVAGRPGPILAACERFEVLIAGVGGHAAMPHLTVDPIVTASAMIMNLQTIVSRTVSPLDSGVVSITKIDAGDAFNIIPHSALIRGTVRALSTETLLHLRNKVQHILESTASTYGANVTITYSPDYYPPTVNDPHLYESFAKYVGGLVMESHASDNKDATTTTTTTPPIAMETEPTMGAEDFSFIAETIPSTFFLLGQGSAQDPPSNYGLHHPHFAIDESVLPTGVELHVNLALRSLKQLQHQNQQQQQPASSSSMS